MPIQVDKINKRRLRSSNITVVVSISLVLFLIGLIGLISINASNFVDFLKEQMIVEIYFKNSTDKKEQNIQEAQHLEYLDSLKTASFVKSVKYISKQQATQVAKKELGIDSNELFEEDIFPASITLVLKPDYVDTQKVEEIKKKLKAHHLIDEVKSDGQLLTKMYKNVQNITLGISILAILILFIAISLINSSIRLKIYAKRFIIKTMQLVGARRLFIMKPFLKEAFWLGLIGSYIALALLFALNYTVIYFNILPQIKEYTNYYWLALVIIGIGLSITFISTFFATWRFLKLRLDDLYYS